MNKMWDMNKDGEQVSETKCNEPYIFNFLFLYIFLLFWIVGCRSIASILFFVSLRTNLSLFPPWIDYSMLAPSPLDVPSNAAPTFVNILIRMNNNDKIKKCKLKNKDEFYTLRNFMVHKISEKSVKLAKKGTPKYPIIHYCCRLIQYYTLTLTSIIQESRFLYCLFNRLVRINSLLVHYHNI